MSVKLYAPAGDELRDAALCADFEAAEKAGPLRVGRLAVYYRKGLKQRAVPLADIASAELHAQSCRTKCCCGRMELEQLHLVLSGAQGELADVYSEDRRAMGSALDALRATLGEGAVSVQD